MTIPLCVTLHMTLQEGRAMLPPSYFGQSLFWHLFKQFTIESGFLLVQTMDP